MALFKISKGQASKLAEQKPVEGYCWFTPDDGKFYIDTATADKAILGTNRICLNAGRADRAVSDQAGLNIANNYTTRDSIISDMNFIDHDIVIYDGYGEEKKTLTIPDASEDEFGFMTAEQAIRLSNLTSVEYGKCTTAAATVAKVITVSDNFVLKEGAQVKVWFTLTNTASNPTLNVNGTGAYPMCNWSFNPQGGTSPIGNTLETSWKPGAVITFTFIGWAWARDYWTDTIPDQAIPVCSTAAATTAKTATCASFNASNNHYFPILMKTSNTKRGTITLNINNTGTKDIYINGTISSSTNYTLPLGLYFVYNDGENYYFRTDGEFPAPLDSGGNYLPLSAGQSYPLTGPLGLTLNQGYGKTLPASGFNGELFFLTTDEEDPILFRSDTAASSASDAIAFPSDISSNIQDDTFLLKVYQNGLLLTPGTNYTVKSDNSGITLNGYECNAGDIYTFELISKGIKGLDASVYATKEFLEARLGNLDVSTKYLPLAGGTMSGNINLGGNNIINGGSITANKVYGAVWNDYAEYRIADTTEPGIVVCENGDDTMSISKERMQPAAAIVSDTFGFAIGKTGKAKTPIAVSGRVLAKPHEPIEEFKKAIGRPVCAGPNGTVSIMSDEEYATKGYCSIGTISAVPNYEIWNNQVQVNGRVWIKVR